MFFIVLLSLALGVAAMAAPVELQGTLGTEIEYIPGEDLSGETALELGWESRLAEDLTAVVGIRFYKEEAETGSDWYDGELNSGSSLYAYAQSTGSLWEGAQPFKLTMGSFDVKYSPYLAWFGYNTKRYDEFGEWFYGNINGVTAEQIPLGSLQARTFYVFSKDVLDDANALGVNLNGKLADLALNATFVKRGLPVAYDLAASLTPVEKLALTGQLIGNGKDAESWYKLAVDYTGISNWQLGASWRDFSGAILEDYPYRDRTPSVDGGEFVTPNPYDLNKGCVGVSLSALTSLAGYDFSGEYDRAVRTAEFTVAKANWSAKLKYFHALTDILTADGKVEFQFADDPTGLLVLRGNAAADIAFLKGVELEGVAEFGDEAVWGGSAAYEAPNGLSIAAEYYSGDLQDDNRLGWTQERGLAITCGYALDF